MTKKIRIALMTYSMDNRPNKGTALYTRRLVECLVMDQRFECHLVHFDEVDDPLYTKANEIIMPKIKLPFATRFVRMLLFFWKYRSQRFDIIHWFQPRLYPFFWLAPASHVVATFHGAGDITSPGAYPLSRYVFNYTAKFFGKKIAAVIADSEFGREEIIANYGLQPAQVHSIYLGGGEDFKSMDKNEARALVRSHYGIEKEYILDISRLQPHKNIDRLIDAYDQIRTKNPNIHDELVIIGAPAFGHEYTYSKARHSLYSGDIRFISFVQQEHLNAFYSGARLFCFPSFNEGFGLPVIEAFASAVPVVTSNVTSLPEISGDAAICVNPYDAEDIARGISHVLNNPSLRDSLVARGLQRATDFKWSNTATETSRLYLRLLAAGELE